VTTETPPRLSTNRRLRVRFVENLIVANRHERSHLDDSPPRGEGECHVAALPLWHSRTSGADLPKAAGSSFTIVFSASLIGPD